MKNTKKGFTLIELLVVIAIIGILASVVLVNLNDARAKGKDASAMSSMASLKTQIELVADGSSYSGLCTNTAVPNTGITNLKAAINAQSGHTMTCDDDSANAWAAQVQLNGTSGPYYCVDSSGFTGKDDAAYTITSGACVAAV